MSFTENNLFYDKGNSKSIWDINNKIPNLLKTLENKYNLQLETDLFFCYILSLFFASILLWTFFLFL